MFKLVNERTAWWPVIWKGVGEDGSVVEHRIELKFRIVSRSEFRELFGFDAPASDPASETDPLNADMALARRVVGEDWRGVGDEKGRALPFSWDGLAQLMEVANFAPAFGLSYVRLFQAAPEEREKNSGASPASGPEVEAADRTDRRSRRSSAAGARARKK